MIQRIQTVFLLLAAILAVVCLVVRWQWLDVVQGLSAVLSVYTIFIYRQRPRQAQLCLLGIALVFVWYILLAVYQGNVTTIDALPMVNAISWRATASWPTRSSSVPPIASGKTHNNRNYRLQEAH